MDTPSLRAATACEPASETKRLSARRSVSVIMRYMLTGIYSGVNMRRLGRLMMGL